MKKIVLAVAIIEVVVGLAAFVTLRTWLRNEKMQHVHHSTISPAPRPG